MARKWYKICNATEFEALDLESKTYTLDFEDIGIKDVLVTQGVAIGITYDDVFLSLELNGENPFTFETFSIYKNDAEDIYLGVVVDES